MKLHIAGEIKNPDWVLYNIDPKTSPQCIGSIENLPFKDNSIEEIYCSHVLEHISSKDISRVLKGINRVLKPGGVFRISVPDLKKVCQRVLDNPDKFSNINILYGCQKDQFDFHKTGYTLEIISDQLKKSGFSKIEVVDQHNLFNDFSKDQISLNIIAIK